MKCEVEKDTGSIRTHWGGEKDGVTTGLLLLLQGESWRHHHQLINHHDQLLLFFPLSLSFFLLTFQRISQHIHCLPSISSTLSFSSVIGFCSSNITLTSEPLQAQSFDHTHAYTHLTHSPCLQPLKRTVQSAGRPPTRPLRPLPQLLLPTAPLAHPVIRLLPLLCLP